MKKSMLLALCLSAIVPYQAAVSASPEAPVVSPASEIVVKLDDLHAVANGRPVLLQTAPTLIGDTTMVPLRFIGEALGAQIGWNGDTQTVALAFGDTSIQLMIGKREALVNGQPKLLEQPAALLNETTMVPLRFVSEQFDRLVAFDAATQTVTLTAKPQPLPVPQPPKRLEKTTVDNLTTDPDVNKNYSYTTYILDIAVDKQDNIYVLEDSGNMGALVKKYDASNGYKMSLFLSVDENLASVNKPPYNSREKLNDWSFHPRYLYSAPHLDKLYLATSEFVYLIHPQLEMITHPYPRSSGPLLGFYIRDTSRPSPSDAPFFETVDGKFFYSGDHKALNVGYRGEFFEYAQNLYGEPGSRVVTTAKDGVILCIRQAQRRHIDSFG